MEVRSAPWRIRPVQKTQARKPSGARRERLSAPTTKNTYGCCSNVREGFAKLDAGKIDEFELDNLIHRYERAAKQLWIFCGSAGSQELHAAATLAHMRDHGEERNWWAESARRRDQP